MYDEMNYLSRADDQDVEYLPSIADEEFSLVGLKCWIEVKSSFTAGKQMSVC